MDSWNEQEKKKMPTCTKCNTDITHLNAFVEETNKYEVELESCPREIPIPLRGKANACLAGGPVSEEYPGGSFCSYLERLGKCKLADNEYQGLSWGRAEAMEGSATVINFNCPECDHTLFTFQGEDSYYTAVEEFLRDEVSESVEVA